MLGSEQSSSASTQCNEEVLEKIVSELEDWKEKQQQIFQDEVKFAYYFTGILNFFRTCYISLILSYLYSNHVRFHVQKYLNSTVLLKFAHFLNMFVYTSGIF